MILIGTLDEDAEMRFTPGGTALALTRVGQQRVELWEGLAEAFMDGPNGAMPLRGDVVKLTGYTKIRKWTGRTGPNSAKVFIAKSFLVLQPGTEASWSG